MPLKLKILFVTVALLISFATGRFTVSERIKTVIQTVEVEKKTDDKKTDAEDHKKVTITENVKPDGTKNKITIITDDRDTKTEDKSVDQLQITQKETQTITRGGSQITVSALVGLNISSSSSTVYGGSISRPLLGPIAVGIFGLSDKTGGFSLGLAF